MMISYAPSIDGSCARQIVSSLVMWRETHENVLIGDRRLASQRVCDLRHIVHIVLLLEA
jgi:hypothetical protein